MDTDAAYYPLVHAIVCVYTMHSVVRMRIENQAWPGSEGGANLGRPGSTLTFTDDTETRRVKAHTGTSLAPVFPFCMRNRNETRHQHHGRWRRGPGRDLRCPAQEARWRAPADLGQDSLVLWGRVPAQLPLPASQM